MFKQLWCLLAIPCSLASQLKGPQEQLNAWPDTQPSQIGFWKYSETDPIHLSEISYSGLNTFAGIPHARCFEDDQRPDSRYDIAILGAPLDTVRDHQKEKVRPTY